MDTTTTLSDAITDDAASELPSSTLTTVEPQPVADGLENPPPLASPSLSTHTAEKSLQSPDHSLGDGARAAEATSSSTQATKKRKRGNQGKFQGPQLEFLRARIDAYLALSTKKERSKWIISTTHEYFQSFPWHMNSEPAEFAVLHDSSASLSNEQRQELETAHDNLLCETVKQGQIELKNWIYRQTQRPAQRNGGEAFQCINNQLKQATKLKKPRRKPDYKYFMSHPEFQQQCQDYYREAIVDDPPSKAERIKKQCELAEDLYNRQPDDVKERISLENSAQYSSQVGAFKKLVHGFSLEGVDELTDVEKQLCRENLLAFIQPLLDAIRAHTGLWLTLLAGAPPQNAQDPDSDFAVLAVSSGTAKGLKFHEWNANDFSDKVMKSFLQFLHAST
ncbi:hypothetical protein EV360DRAFT_77133, partial [Lentinula raphanica]